MKFMLTFSLKPETKTRDEAIGRFKAAGGRSPKGAKLLGRWTAADFSGGFDLLESDDVRALTEFSLMWSGDEVHADLLLEAGNQNARRGNRAI